MSTASFLEIVQHINLVSFTKQASVKIRWWNDTAGKFYYRLRCEASRYTRPDFPTTYLYIGNGYSTVPDYYYNMQFGVTKITDVNGNITSFEALFTRYPDVQSLRPTATLEIADNAEFTGAVIEADNTHDLDINLDSSGSFGPAWVKPTWADIKSGIAGVKTLTGDDAFKGVQGFSEIRFDYPTASGRYGTSVEHYTLTVAGGLSVAYTPDELEAAQGHIYMALSDYRNLTGDTSVTFTVEDSRGMITRYQATLTVVAYKTPYLSMNDTHRQGGTGSTVILDFSGMWNGAPLTMSCQSVTAYEEGSSQALYTLVPAISVSGTSFSVHHVWDAVRFDSGKAYRIVAVFSDTVQEISIILPIPVGTPVLSIRDKRIGINNPSPQTALDVSGVISQNNMAVLGNIEEIKDEIDDSVDLNDYLTAGIYAYLDLAETINHFPAENAPLLLEVLRFGDLWIQKAYYVDTGAVYIRTGTAGGSSVSWHLLS